MVNRTPKIGINYRSCNVNRFDNVISAINIRVADNLDTYAFGGGFLVHDNRCYILVQIFCQNGLHDNYVHVAFHGFYNP